MKNQEFKNLDAALELANNGIAVYPTVPGKKAPFKGTHAQKDASNDPERVFKMFQAHPEADVSIKLDGLIVLDIDNHQGQQEGLTSLGQASIEVPTNTRIERTPNNGLHVFFKYNGEKFNHLDILKGVEVRGDQIKTVPSVGYELTKSNDIAEAPEWLLEYVSQALKPKYKPTNGRLPGEITFVGKTLNRLLDGAPEGSRNNWLTKQIGFLIGQGFAPSKCYELMWWITQNKLTGNKPIKKTEFDNTFKSVLKREQSKLGGGLNE